MGVCEGEFLFLNFVGVQIEQLIAILFEQNSALFREKNLTFDHVGTSCISLGFWVLNEGGSFFVFNVGSMYTLFYVFFLPSSVVCKVSTYIIHGPYVWSFNYYLVYRVKHVPTIVFNQRPSFGSGVPSFHKLSQNFFLLVLPSTTFSLVRGYATS